MAENDYIIESIAMGNSMKVTAIDPKTLTEAVVIVPSSATRSEAAELAIRKLHYMLSKKT